MVNTLDFLGAFFRPDDAVYLRLLDDPGIIPKDTQWKQKFRYKASDMSDMLRILAQKNQERKGVFFVVNGGGHTNAEITTIRAQFVDLDSGDKAAMIENINSFPLRPSIVVETKKGYHVYWLIQDGSVSLFRRVQSKLIGRFGADRACVNEARVLRIPGFYHCKGDPFLIQCVYFQPQLVYTQAQLLAAMPEQEVVRKPIPEFAGEGDRNNTLYLKACSLRGQGLDGEELEAAVRLENEHAIIPPLDDSEVDTVIRSASKFQPGRLVAGDIRDTDLDALPAYIVPKRNKNGDVVKLEVSPPLLAQHIRTTQHYFMARENALSAATMFWYIRGVYVAASSDMVKGFIKGLITAVDVSLLKMSDVVETYSDLVTDLKFEMVENLNRDENIINFRNGLLYLDTMELYPHTPAVASTIQIPCDWVPDATCPTFDAYMETLCGGSEDVAHVLLQFLGLTLSNIPGYRVKKSLFMVGPGNTGKSQLRELAVRMIGEGNTSSLTLERLEARFGTASLFNKRLGGTAETGFMRVGELLMFKALTGGDSVPCERKGVDAFSFKFKGVLWFCGNQNPRFGGDCGDWVYDRMLVVPCENVIPEESQDSKLLEKMLEERSGIVVRAVAALQRLIANRFNLTVPDVLTKPQERLKDDNESVRQFVHDCLVHPDESKGAAVPRTMLFQVYKLWCRDNNGGYFTKKPLFYAGLESLGSGEPTRTNSVRFYPNLTLSDEARFDYGVI